MIINNLKLKFNKEENNQLFFSTDSGAQVIFDKSLITDIDQGELYLALDNEQLISSQDNKKELLNQMLNPSEDNK